METIILASSSSRRRRLLDQVGLPYMAVAADLEERISLVEDPEVLTKNLAAAKAYAAVRILNEAEYHWIAAFDTLIETAGNIFGKPESRREAQAMLETLAGKSHRVITGAALLPGRESDPLIESCISTVNFASMTQSEIENYLDTGEWQDAAGAYKIQGRGALYIESISGSYSNIVGLPISKFYGMLRKAGYFDF